MAHRFAVGDRVRYSWHADFPIEAVIYDLITCRDRNGNRVPGYCMQRAGTGMAVYGRDTVADTNPTLELVEAAEPGTTMSDVIVKLSKGRRR